MSCLSLTRGLVTSFLRFRATQLDDSSAPPAIFRVIERKRLDVGMFGQYAVHCPAEVPNAFAVNDAEAENASLAAGLYIIRHKSLDLTRIESMQIKDSIDRELVRLVHFQKSNYKGAKKRRKQ